MIAVNVPARFMAKPLEPGYWFLALFALVATAACMIASRWMFTRSLEAYRSASS